MKKRMSFAIKVLRKWTSPVHYVYGLLCAYLTYEFGLLAGLIMMGLFAGDELWGDYCYDTKEGGDDWWESFLFYTIGLGVLALLQTLGLIHISWF